MVDGLRRRRHAAVAFLGTSIGSGRDGFDIDAVRQAEIERNPHMKFLDNRRGYGVREPNEPRMLVHCRALHHVARPRAPLATKASFAVEAAKPGVNGA